MNPNLYSSFYNIIDDWIGKHIDAQEFPAFYVPHDLAEQMASVAARLFDAVVGSQEYAEAFRADDEEYIRQLPPAKAGGLSFQVSSHEETEV